MMPTRKTIEEWQALADTLGKFKLISFAEKRRNKRRVNVICRTCSYESVVFVDMLKENGCPVCSGKYNKTPEEALKTVSERHPELLFEPFNYKNVYTKIPYTCIKCGNKNQTTYTHLIDRNAGCPHCKVSVLEKTTRDILDKSEFNYNAQYKFDGCKNKRRLPFDFYLPTLNTCIECQGIQHFKEIPWFEGPTGTYGFSYRQYNDSIKIDFCRSSNINLLYIINRKHEQYKNWYENTIFIDELEAYLINQ